MLRNKNLALLLVSTALTIPAFASTTQAADQTSQPAATQLGEVLVTATRRQAVSINKVAMSINALPQSQLDDMNIKTGEDLSRLVPALRITSNGPTGRNISIRGASENIVSLRACSTGR